MMMRLSKLFSFIAVVLLVAVLFASTITVPVTAQTSWNTEDVDASPQTGYYTAIAIDSSGNPHISYSDYTTTTNSLYYAHKDSSGWHIEKLDSGDVEGATSIAIDTFGYPHISYHQHTNLGHPVCELKYAYKDASGWHIETVESGNIVGGSNSLVLDSANRPHIAYSDNSLQALKVADYTGSKWDISIVDPTGWGWAASMRIDSLSRFQIAYLDYNSGSLKYALKDAASSWKIETVDVGAAHDVLSASLAVDSSNRPHIAYGLSQPTRMLKYAYKDASGWQIASISPGGYFASLTLDSADRPHIACEGYYGTLDYTHKEVDGWHSDNVDSYGYFPSIAIDASGQLRISYMGPIHAGSDGLKYAIGNQPTPPPPTTWQSLGGYLTSAPAATSPTSGAVDVFVRGTDNALWWRHWSGQDWSTWTSLGGYLTSSPAAVSWGPGRIDVFVRGGDGALWHQGYHGTWDSWESRGGVLAPGTGPAACSWGAGRLDVFVEGMDGALWSKAYQNGWSDWNPLGGVLTASPAATSPASGVIDVFVRGTTGALWQKEYSNGWHDWSPLGGQLAPGTSPAACSWGLDRLDVSVVGTDGALWHQSYAGVWSAWQSLGGYLTASPAATSPTSGAVSVFVRGSTGELWWMTYYN